MPKIPMLNPNAVNHQSSVVHMTGAPGMNFKMDESRALINFGNTLSDFGGTIANAGTKAVSAIAKFQQEQQYTEDRLAATEARNLYRDLNAKLDGRMAENPGEFGKFKEWAEETDKTYIDQVKSITDRMSPNFRKEFDAEMAGLRIESLNRRTRIGIQAKVTADYNLFQSQWKDAALRNDLPECDRMLSEHRGKLISEQEYQQKKLEYNRLAEFGTVRRAVESNSPGIVEQLEERNSTGGYKNYTNLDESSRNQLIKFAKAKSAEQLANEYQEICAGIISSGKFPFTKEQMDEYHASGAWSAKKYNMINSLYEGYQKSLVQKDTQKNQAQEKQKTAMLNSIKGQIDLMEYPHPDHAADFKLKYTEQIQKIFPNDPYRQAQAIEHLDNFLKNDPLGKTENGRMLKSYIIDTVDAINKDKDKKNAMESVDLINLRTEMLVAARKLVNDPKMTFAEAAKKLDELKTAYCNKQIRSFINPSSGNLRDMSKYGKVFDSREIMDNSGANWFTRLWVPEFDNMRKNKIDKLKNEGYIDRADIVRTATATNKNGRKRTVWIMKDGRELFADEYE